MASIIVLCNQALAQIAASSIADLDEISIEAREARRFAQPLLDEMADWAEWPLGRKRISLAQVTNYRTGEWRFCYAVPTDMAVPLEIRMPQTTTGQGSPGFPFAYDGGKIHTDVEFAVLIYNRSTLTADELKPLQQRAFVLELAARIALPIKKEAKLAESLSRLAEMARARAIADEENKEPRRVTRYVSDAELARTGCLD